MYGICVGCVFVCSLCQNHKFKEVEFHRKFLAMTIIPGVLLVDKNG